ncbi:MAG TPA: hypothetical protein PK413_21700, partial [Thermoanaerobaculia bacterium]|nr:hypothetical protein [Thermoanaerobaculia bacterium]
LTCPADCAPGCGDTTCADTESCDSCPIDCCPGPLPAECGNGLCEGPKEGPDSCPEDCGQPPTGPIPPPPPPPVCGDNRCDLGESPCNCQADCGPPAPGANCLCGNGLCERGKGETCVTCAADCGSCAPPSTGVCGNLICEEDKHENCSNCNLDCGACPVFEDTEIPEPPSDPSLQFDGLDPNFQEHFVPDLSSEDYPFPILGDTTHEVATPLSRPTGERDVVYRKVGGGGSTVLNTASPSWNLLAAGIQLSGGRTAVCWNRLVGTDSAATHGTMPDPRGGVALLCRTWNGTAWGAEQVISAGQPASWLQELKLNAQGKAVVVYLKDSFGTLFNTGKPGDGIVVQTPIYPPFL